MNAISGECSGTCALAVEMPAASHLVCRFPNLAVVSYCSIAKHLAKPLLTSSFWYYDALESEPQDTNDTASDRILHSRLGATAVQFAVCMRCRRLFVADCGQVTSFNLLGWTCEWMAKRSDRISQHCSYEELPHQMNFTRIAA